MSVSRWALVAVFLLSGCDAFGSGSQPMSFRTLALTSDLVTGMTATNDDFGPRPALVIRSAEDAARVLDDYTLSAPLPTVDYTRESIVGVVARAADAGATIELMEVSLIGDDDDTLLVVTEQRGRSAPRGEAAAAYPVHLVAVPRLPLPITGFEVQPTTTALGG